MNIGEKIKKLRKEKNLTQKQLGESIGKSEISVRKYESGQTNVPVEVLFKISDILEVHPSELITSNINKDSTIEVFKQYLESRNHSISDINLIKEMEHYINEYIEFKLYIEKRKNNKE